MIRRYQQERDAPTGSRTLAYTLSMVAPPWVRIVPYYAGNSLIISGPAAAVEELLDIIR